MNIDIGNLTEEQLRIELARLQAERVHLINEMVNNKNLEYAIKGAIAVLSAKKNNCDCKKGSPHVDQTN